MPKKFQRTQHTWLLYLVFAVFGFMINALGPVTPFLKADLQLSYTVSSLVFSAFAAGMILTGLVGHVLVQRAGREKVLWLGLFGMCFSALGLAAAQAAWTAVGAAFFTGFSGSMLATVVPSSLANEHGALRSVALAELNLIAAVSSAAAPLMVGWFSYTLLGWRFALALPLIAALVLRFGKSRQIHLADADLAQTAGQAGKKLPSRYWVLWFAIILANAIEYCMLSWCADYLENVSGLPKGIAAQAVSIFLAGMILGRLVGSRVLLRFSAYSVITASILIAGAGFALYWIAATAWMAVAGLFLSGLGVANQFPLILSLAIGASDGRTVEATAKSTLASGIAIFTLPLALGRLADMVGIHLAYGIIAILLGAAFAIIQFTARSAPAQPVHSNNPART